MPEQTQSIQSNINPTMVNFDVVKFLGGTDNSTAKFIQTLFNIVVTTDAKGVKSYNLSKQQILTEDGRYNLLCLINANFNEIIKLSFSEDYEKLSRDKALFLNNLATDFSIHKEEWFVNGEKDMNFVYNMFREYFKALKDSNIKGFTMRKLGESVNVNNSTNVNNEEQKKGGFGFWKK